MTGTTSQQIVNGQQEANKPLTPADGRKNLSLFRLESELSDLMQLREEISEADGDTDAVDGEIARYVQAELLKVDGIRAFLRHCSVMQQAAKEEAAIQSARAQAWGGRAEALEKACVFALEAAGKKSVEGRTGKLSVRPNGGKQALVIDDEKALPSVYVPMTVTYEVNRDLLRKDLESGDKVPGAHLAERGKHLVIT